MTSNSPRLQPSAWPAALVCALTCFVVFQFFGNATRGYIDTTSLFYWWGFQWANPESESEHGWLILGLSGWLLWRNLREAKSPELRAESSENLAPDSQLSALDWRGFTALVAGLALHALGFAAQQTRVSIVAFLLCLWGVLRLGGGRRWGVAAVFPLGFLIFAIPVNLLDSVGFALRMWVVEASAAIAHAAGIGVLRSGTQLVSPDGAYHYDVAAACSGVRSLTAMVALSLLAGYLNFRSWPRRALVLLLCLPLVYLGNVARIVAIVLAAQLGGTKWGNIVHDVMGFGTFLIVLGGVLAGIAGLRRWWPEKRLEAGGERPEEERATEAGGPPSRRLPLASSLAIAIVALAVAEMFFLQHLARLPARGGVGVMLAADGLNPVELPAFLGTEWIGQSAVVSVVEREILPPDTGFSRRNYAFVADRRRDVFLSVVLSGRDRTSIHRPELCLVGQGWTITEAARHTFGYPGRPDATFAATLLRVQREVALPAVPGRAGAKETVPQLVAYWFVGGDGVVPSHVQRMARDAWNRVAHGRADRWAYVLVQTDARDGEAAALARIQTVLDATLPAFQPPWPSP